MSESSIDKKVDLMVDPSEAYGWQMSDHKGNIHSQYSSDGREFPFPSIDPNNVVRLSFEPRAVGLPPHCLVFTDGLKFVRRFGRGFIRIGTEGQDARYYLYCVVTNSFRFYLLPNGRVIITHKDYEMRRI
jgi:hypothetical protein